MATSAVAQGKIRVAHNKREKVSPDWLIDDQGNPPPDPRFGVIEPFGALRTFGLHKGYGLAVVCELLGGALTGGGTWHSDDRSKKRVWNGMLTILIDPKRMGTAPRSRTKPPRSSSPAPTVPARGASTRCASPANRSARRARSARATASRSTRTPGTRSSRPAPSWAWNRRRSSGSRTARSRAVRSLPAARTGGRGPAALGTPERSACAVQSRVRVQSSVRQWDRSTGTVIESMMVRLAPPITSSLKRECP